MFIGCVHCDLHWLHALTQAVPAGYTMIYCDAGNTCHFCGIITRICQIISLSWQQLLGGDTFSCQCAFLTMSSLFKMLCSDVECANTA